MKTRVLKLVQVIIILVCIGLILYWVQPVNASEVPHVESGVTLTLREYLSDDYSYNGSTTTNDRELLARLIFAECGSDDMDMIALYWTGSVVLNRVESENFPNTIEEVIYDSGQYACIDDGHINNTPTDRVYEVVDTLFVYGSILPSDVVYQAQFEQGSSTYAYIQGLYFCRE
jgi:hypothetical protein